MRVENKKFYYFEKREKGLFVDFLWLNKTTMSEFAELCGISASLLSLVVNGKKPITKRTLEIFKKNGFNLEIEDE